LYADDFSSVFFIEKDPVITILVLTGSGCY
jgi:hypothetical protein